MIGLIAAPQIADVLTTGAPNAKIAAQQESLATFFLWFFIPQVLFYGWGTVSTAVLYAKRSFAIPAIAPIANTIILVISLVDLLDPARQRRRPRAHAHREAGARASARPWEWSGSSAFPQSRCTAPASGSGPG